MSKGNTIAGVLVGLAAGAALGILFAPEKGSVTRQQILDKGNDYADDLKSKYNEFADSIAEKLQSGKEFAQALAENGKAEFDELNNDVNHSESNYKL